MLIKNFFCIFPAWERLVKAWKGWRAAAAAEKEATTAAKEAKLAAVVEARLASAKKSGRRGPLPQLGRVGPGGLGAEWGFGVRRTGGGSI